MLGVWRVAKVHAHNHPLAATAVLDFIASFDKIVPVADAMSANDAQTMWLA
jgi:hypothetical protein